MPNFLGALPQYIGDDMVVLGRGRGGRGAFGLLPHSSQMMSPKHAAAAARANHVASLVNPDVPGVPARDAALLPFGFPVFSFAAATGTGNLTQTLNIQTPFRGQRLTCIVVRSGTSAATTAPVINTFIVGQKPIVTPASPVALEIFNQQSFDTNLLLPPTIPGVIYTMTINLTAALTTTDTLLCIVGVIGSAVL